MNIEELEEICSEKNVIKKFKNRFPQTSWYSIGKNLREYAYFYPKNRALEVLVDHGINGCEEIYQYEIDADVPVFLTCNKKRELKYRKLTNKLSRTIIMPNIYYRRKNKIVQSEDAIGTIVFPFHTTPNSENLFDIEKYIQQLKELPEKFQPIVICLHANDVNKSEHLKYMNNGLKVVSAGHYEDDRFTERFYNILKNFKYSTSNCIGSHTYYSVEMGIPFFIYGERETYINKSDSNVPIGQIDYLKEDVFFKAYKLFSQENIEITEEKMDLTLENCGAKHPISRLECTFLLFYSLIIGKAQYIVNDVAKKIAPNKFTEKVFRGLLKNCYKKD